MNRERIARPRGASASARALVRAGVVALLLVACGSASAGETGGYPRLGLYGHVFGRGEPLVHDDDSLNLPLIDEISRFHVVILDASPLTEYHPEVLAAIRARNPEIKLIAYAQANYIYNAREADSLVNMPTFIRNTVRNLDGFLYETDGTEYVSSNINMAKRDAQGRYVVAETMADLFIDRILSTGLWDGLFLDRYCQQIQWMQSFGDSIDYVRAGYSNFSEFHAAWSVGTDTLAQRLRRLGGPTVLLSANCGSGIQYEAFNGWMREGFPNQNGETWDANMFRQPGGYLYDQTRFRPPYEGWIVSWPVGSLVTPYTSDNMRRSRWSLGSAALGDGYGTHNPPQLDPFTGYMSWWYDEFAVNKQTGMSSALREDTGWLGRPKGPAGQLLWAQPGEPDAAELNPGFEAPLSTGWTFETTVGATAARVVGPSPEGTAAARITVPAPGVAWSTAFTTTGTVPYSADTYSAIFWAKSSVRRTIWVNGVSPMNVPYQTNLVTLDTTWTRHQVVFTGQLGIARLQFRVGQYAGDVWLDDVHFQRGKRSVWRRDFDFGTVLVNPSLDAFDVALERPMRRIRGLRDPAVNNGALSNVVRVLPNDAVFLLKSLDDLVGVDDPPPVGASRLAWASASPIPARAGSETVRLVLSAPSALDRVDVVVYDARGRRVRTVFAGALAAGTHSLAWDGRDEGGRTVAPGLYFARARTGGAEAVRKLVCR